MSEGSKWEIRETARQIGVSDRTMFLLLKEIRTEGSQLDRLLKSIHVSLLTVQESRITKVFFHREGLKDELALYRNVNLTARPTIKI